ncbi:hypothetical protein Tco_0108167, partial [Tanacetum coccineum]
MEIRPIWNNVQRVNHKNQYVPTAVLTRTGKIPVNTVRTNGTNTVNTARYNFNRQAVPTNAAIKVNTVKPIVNNARPKGDFRKSVAPFRKSLNKSTTLRTIFSYQKVNTAEVNAVSAVGGKGKLLLSPQHVIIGDQKDITGTKSPNTMVDQVLEMDYPQRTLQNKGIVDSGFSTDKEKDSTDRPDEGTVDQTEGRSTTPTTPTTTPTIFGDDETIAQVLINMSQAKAVS